MQQIQDLLGREVNLDACNRALRDFANSQRAPVVGAVHVCCSDECEREATESFQHWFAEALLPELKFSARSAFRSVNLGGRYEWGAIRIAEEHFALQSTRDKFKVMVVKINSHVAALDAAGEQVFGKMNRYETDSVCCGALGALLGGTRHPSMDEIRMTFAYDNLPRLEMLRDPDTTPPAQRAFLAAVVNARLQARSAIVDIQDYRPKSPTVTVVVPTVTINRPQRDTEFVVGMYWADSREGIGEAQYVGLSDDPSQYEVTRAHGYLNIRDSQLGEKREARDHRVLVAQQWRSVQPQVEHLNEQQRQKIAEVTDADTATSPKLAYETLKTAIWLAADFVPIPMSIMLFAKGIVGIHHLYQVHHLARGLGNDDDAREILDEITDQVTSMPVERVQETIASIRSHCQSPT